MKKIYDSIMTTEKRSDDIPDFKDMEQSMIKIIVIIGCMLLLSKNMYFKITSEDTVGQRSFISEISTNRTNQHYNNAVSPADHEQALINSMRELLTCLQDEDRKPDGQINQVFENYRHLDRVVDTLLFATPENTSEERVTWKLLLDGIPQKPVSAIDSTIQ